MKRLSKWWFIISAFLILLPYRVLADTSTTTTASDAGGAFLHLLPLVWAFGCFVGCILLLVKGKFRWMFITIMFGLIGYVILSYALTSLGSLL